MTLLHLTMPLWAQRDLQKLENHSWTNRMCSLWLLGHSWRDIHSHKNFWWTLSNGMKSWLFLWLILLFLSLTSIWLYWFKMFLFSKILLIEHSRQSYMFSLTKLLVLMTQWSSLHISCFGKNQVGKNYTHPKGFLSFLNALSPSTPTLSTNVATMFLYFYLLNPTPPPNPFYRSLRSSRLMYPQLPSDTGKHFILQNCTI